MPFITTPERYGREEGITKGIEVALRIKFGKAAAGLMSEIRAIVEEIELDKLETILNAIETAESPDDLRRIWAK